MEDARATLNEKECVGARSRGIAFGVDVDYGKW